MLQTIAIVAAMPEEQAALLNLFPEYAARTHFHTVLHCARHANQDLVVALSGVGKVNAACTLALLLSDFDVGCVINIGSAGGVQPGQHVLDLVVPREAVYTDVDVTSFGFAYGQMYGEPARYPADPRMLDLFDSLVAAEAITCHHGLLGSADSFITRPDQVATIHTRFNNEVHAVDMEGAAVAHVCTRFGVPFIILRALSDVPGEAGDNTRDFKVFLKRAAARSAHLCLEMVKRLETIDRLKTEG
jgi:adenosylhomocysteine nucleosidase